MNIHAIRPGQAVKTIPRTIVGCAVAAAMLGACASDDSSPDDAGGESMGAGESTGGTTGTPGSGAGPGDSGDSDTSSGEGGSETPAGPAVIATQLLSEDATVSYLVVADAVDGTLSIDDGIEIAGRALVAGPGQGRAYVGTNLDGSVTRYDLRGGTLEASATVSFMGQGVTGIGEYASQFHFLSLSRAYYFDGGSARVIVWDPEAMTLEGALALPDAAVQGTVLTFTSTTILETAGRLYMPLAWRGTDNITILARAGIVILDPTDDSVTTAIDERCGYVRDAVLGEDGRIYVATEAYASAVYRVVSGDTPVPCLLRFDPETGAFDPDFHVELPSLFGDSTAGSMIQATDGTAFVHVLDESLFEVDADTHPRVLASAPAWRWWTIALGDAPVVTEATGLAAASGSMVRIEIGGRTFVPEFSSDRTSTGLRELSSASASEVVATIPGMVFSAADL